MSKPLTRTEDDVDRENLLKDQVGDERVILNCSFQFTEQRCCQSELNPFELFNRLLSFRAKLIYELSIYSLFFTCLYRIFPKAYFAFFFSFLTIFPFLSYFTLFFISLYTFSIPSNIPPPFPHLETRPGIGSNIHRPAPSCKKED